MCAPSPPPPPDYAAIAQQQGAANIEAAQATASLNNPNIINPYGTQTVEYGAGATLDQAAYDKAMADYQAALNTFNNPAPAAPAAPTGPAPGTYGYVANYQGGGPIAKAPTAATPVKPIMPDQKDFMVGGNKNQATVTQTFAPEQQRLFDQSNLNKGLLGDLSTQGITALQGIVGQPLDLSRVAVAPTAYQTPTTLATSKAPSVLDQSKLPPMPQLSEAIRNQVIDAMMSRVNTDTGIRRDDTNSTLLASGIRPGAKAYGTSMDQIDRAYNDARQQAIIAGTDAAAKQYGMDLATRQQGAGEQQQQFGQELTSGNQSFQQQLAALQQSQAGQNQQFTQQDALRRQQIAEILAQRQTPLNEVSALMGGSQVTNPFAGSMGYQGGASTQPAPIMNAAQAAAEAQQAQYAQRVGSSNSMLSGLFGLGSAAFGVPGGVAMFSDRRLKTNVSRIGTHKLGIGLYEWDYLWGEHAAGVMADELEPIMPEAIGEIGGYKTVNYAMIGV